MSNQQRLPPLANGAAARALRHRPPWRTALLGLFGAAVALVLAACGAAQTATAVQSSAVAAATAAPTSAAGIAATAAAAATTVATGAAGIAATGAAAATNAAPTVQAVATAGVATAQAAATQVAGTTSGPEATVTGRVTRVDAGARTFTLQGTDGKTYDFRVTGDSRADLDALAADLARNRQVEVTYRNTTPPYEVVSVR